MMKKIVILVIVTLLASFASEMFAAGIQKSKLRVLYVGGSADKNANAYASAADLQKGVKERMEAFEQMLKTYFTEVTVVHADQYTQAMSADYDVTVLDGTPKAIVPEYMNMQEQVYKRPGYFTEDFSKPVVTIGELASTLFSRVGSKNDWYCLCLDADAHGWKGEHPIFNGPFQVKMTVVNKPVPEEAVYYAYSYNGKMPKELPMWQVQTKGYRMDESFRVGLVSRPEGYEDSPEAEIISGGVSSKSLDAVAIGRHGNLFHWGFAASPLYLTEEAKTVLANAIVYISRFDGQGIIARKYEETIATRNAVKEFKHMAGKEAYQMVCEMTEVANRTVEEMKKKAKEKQSRGENLSEEEKGLLNIPPMVQKTREEFLQMVMPQYFAMFGTDEQAYAKYFDENKDYFYGNVGRFTLVVDEDAKSLGIPTGDIRLIDEAIKMLETGKNTAKGRRILMRYTLVDFPTAKAWRDWFEKNKSKLFFTEAGGWVFLVNSREPGVNDYKAWELRKKQAALSVEETNERKPVSVAASREVLQSGEQVVFVKVKIHPTYHIYADLKSNTAFIPTKVDITLPKGYEKAGGMLKPAAVPYQNGMTVYQDTVVFCQPISGSGSGTIECRLSYQCCNSHICLPPAEESVKVEVK